MPVAGFLVGYLTNFLALKMIFEPIFPVYVCGLKIQGLFLQRQQEVSAEFARVQAAVSGPLWMGLRCGCVLCGASRGGWACVARQNLLKSETMWHYMLNGRLRHAFFDRLKAHSVAFTNRMLGPVKPLCVLYLGADAYEVRPVVRGGCHVVDQRPCAAHPVTRRGCFV